ncbi:MAG: NAD(P)H-dependent oxidoreductase subunit E [Treponema sp.]|jgi:NADH-quinone oxidoreductase subunit E|nr:NAD(P)H-dependent oxidoreductase subunit E [Treponema sp.]
MDTAFDYEALDAIISKTGCGASAVIPVLQGVQERYNYLPPEVFPYVAEKLQISEARIYGVATFYENFSLEPKGRYIIKVCDGTACHVRKSVPNLDQFRKELGLSESKITTGDLGFTVQTVACLGACSLAPALTVNNKVYAAMTPEKVSALIKELKAELVEAGGN